MNTQKLFITRSFILLFIVCGFISTITQAQQSGREVYPRQASIEHNDAVKSFSGDFVTTTPGNALFGSFQKLMNGIDNLAAVNVLGSENATFLLQEGYGIVGIMNVAGSNNQTSLQQKGSDLLSVLSINGNSNQFDFTQQGNNLQNYFHVLGSGLEFNVVQTNAGMSLMQSGIGSIPLLIQQTGRPSPVIISNH